MTIEQRRIAALAIICIAGFCLRAMNIAVWPLWSDEAMTLLIAQRPYVSLFLAPTDPTAGLYYALHKALLGPDVGVVAARSISLVTGTLTIPAAYCFAKAARVPALLTASFVALSFPLIDYSQEARAYALLVLIVTCSAWAFVSQRWLLFALSCVLAFYTHFISVFWIVPAASVAFLKFRPARLPLVLAAVLSVGELWRLVRYPAGDFGWLPQATPLQAIRIWALCLLPVLLLLPFSKRPTLRNPMTPWALGILMAAPLAIWLTGFIKPIYMERTILIAVPGYLGALALCIRPRFRFAAIGVFAACLAFTGTVRAKENWHSVRISGTPILCEPRQAAAFRHATNYGGPVILRYSDREVEISGSMRDYFLALSTANFKEVNTKGASCISVTDQGRSI